MCSLLDDPEDPSHPGVDATEERVRPGWKVCRGAPAQTTHTRRPVAELAGIELDAAPGQRVGDPVVQIARVLTRRDRVEDRRHVERIRIDRVERAALLRVLVDELQSVALGDRWDASQRAVGGEVTREVSEAHDLDLP